MFRYQNEFEYFFHYQLTIIIFNIYSGFYFDRVLKLQKKLKKKENSNENKIYFSFPISTINRANKLKLFDNVNFLANNLPLEIICSNKPFVFLLSRKIYKNKILLNKVEKKTSKLLDDLHLDQSI